MGGGGGEGEGEEGKSGGGGGGVRECQWWREVERRWVRQWERARRRSG